ncbi:acyl esterase [Streptomyces cinnamoneus]|uniref:Acyl esterase n=1 Tax=Streptomyces cinnamoneus TaxID=53446 RepID=A0A2G1XA68_STRCJ|nr:CocE/NonD family hydrolase [Streptomyces cinnamoneus]PHQ48137.1 acyl esterase [Streptomyces cinnamoneus]PPT15763.1 acyl esterase [Streptomyces cinnamoneus]
MRLTRQALRSTAAGAVCVALLAGGALGTPSAQAAPRAVAAGTAAADMVFTDIPGSGGITLKGNVLSPAHADGSRRYPLIVLPTSWAMPQIEYVAQARKLADAGYVVVSYTARGFWLSGGEIETAGPPDVADASKVIDWALAHTPADPGRIGMAGVSYGAGISLLAAGADRRVRAVVALSGWADLIESIYSGRTQHVQATGLLGGLGAVTGRPSPQMRRMLDEFLGPDVVAKEPELMAWGAGRSPATHLSDINAGGAAVMLGNAWGDSVFPPNQYVKFYENLTGPKRLELRPGDHATAEGTGLLGLPNDTWTNARRWFDHHLRGADNGIDREAPVQLKSRSDGGYEAYPDWASVERTRRTVPLTGSRTVRTGVDSGADGGVVLLSNTLDQFLKLPPLVSVPLLPRAYAAVWQSGPYDRPQRVRGTVRLHTTLTSDKESGTAVAYLYDVGPLGVGRLVSHAPYTFHGRTPGQSFGVDLDLFSTAYDVPAGHRLALVVDSVDPLYVQHNPVGARLTFSSPAADPSVLSVPVRE